MRFRPVRQLAFLFVEFLSPQARKLLPASPAPDTPRESGRRKVYSGKRRRKSKERPQPPSAGRRTEKAGWRLAMTTTTDDGVDWRKARPTERRAGGRTDLGFHGKRSCSTHSRRPNYSFKCAKRKMYFSTFLGPFVVACPFLEEMYLVGWGNSTL